MSALRRVTVNLRPRDVERLDTIQAHFGVSTGDAVSRALADHAYLWRRQREGALILTTDGERVHEVVLP